MRETAVYARSYFGIFIALYLKAKSMDVLVVTSSEDVVRFCIDAQMRYLKIKRFSPQQFVCAPWKIKGEIARVIDAIQGLDLHFTHRQFDIFCFLLVSRYEKMAEVRFYPIETVYLSERVGLLPIRLFLKMVRMLLIRLGVRALYNIDLKVINKTGLLLLAIDDNFFKKHGIHVHKFERDFESVKTELFLANQIELFPSKNLFVSQNLENFPQIVSRESVLAMYDKLIDFDLSVKLHPNMNEKNLFQNAKKYPDHIPAEMIFTNISNAIVSVHSLVLVAAARFPGIKAVSLLHFLDWSNPGFKQDMEDFLRKESGDAVYFPKTYADLAALLLPEGNTFQ